ncbi:hypothetical protein H2200_007207 [Cladophialophora chaetospira]|uniref:F-box domain-containing protein n=1 Tax=Cladophialophora chaetospira TaxID=386627 RepID=A0AA39CH95_9EURO|nr:hypothetical protein H2200_007207 [Cladophialophora chaetospira]
MAPSNKPKSKPKQASKTRARKNKSGRNRPSKNPTATKPPCYLLDLPNEIFYHVLEQLTEEDKWNPTTLSSLCQTCKVALDLSQYDELDVVLENKKARKHFVQNLILAPAKNIKSLADAQVLLSLVSRFPGLKYLRVNLVECGSLAPHHWMDLLEYEMDNSAFSELRDCDLTLWHDKSYTPPLVDLLSAPQLVNLRLCGVDLRDFTAESIDNHSTCLADLVLADCQVEERSLSEFLAKPHGLKSILISGLTYDFSQTTYGHRAVEVEASTIQLVLRVLSREQQGLTELAIFFAEARLLEWEDRKGIVDFGQFKNLVEISVYGRRLRIPNAIWKPKNAFDRLPDTLERMMVDVESAGIDVSGLADAILGTELPGKGFPASLQELDFLAEQNHQRPFNKTDQETEDKMISGIARFMTNSDLNCLTYTQQHWHRGRFAARHELGWLRRLSATRKTVAEEGKASSSNATSYELEDETWE